MGFPILEVAMAHGCVSAPEFDGMDTADTSTEMSPPATGMGKGAGGDFTPLFQMIDTTKDCDVTKYTIVGDDSQVITVMLGQGDSVTTEPSAMFHMSDGVTADISCAPCFRWCFLGESCCLTTYTNGAGAPGYIGLSPPFPAKMIAEPLPSGKEWIVKRGGYLANIGSPENTQVELDADCCSKTCCFGGLGWARQKIFSPTGNGMMIVNAGGTIMKKELGEGEKIMVDHGGIVAYTSNLNYTVEMVGGLAMICFGGEGCCAGVLEGPGTVYMTSMSWEKFKFAVKPRGTEQGTSS